LQALLRGIGKTFGHKSPLNLGRGQSLDEFDAITQRRTEIFAYQGDQSTNPKPNEPPAQFMTLQRNELIPEMNGQYGNLMMTSSAGCSWTLCFVRTATTSWQQSCWACMKSACTGS